MIANKYKIYRSKKNSKLVTMCNSAASIWNHVILLRKMYYKMYRKGVSKKRMRQQIAKLRKTNMYWHQLNSQTVQEIVDRVYDSYDRFFKKLAKRPPKLKKWRDFKSFVFTQSGWKIEGNKLTINKIGNFKFSKSREYYDIKNIRVKRDSVGDWWLIITSSQSVEGKIFNKSHEGAVGFDFSLPKFLIGSDGYEYSSPLFYKQGGTKISKLNRQLAKKKKGSKNRAKARVSLAREYRKIVYKRRDHHWKLSHEISYRYSHIFLETLDIEGMKKLWGKKISDLSLSSFLYILKHVALKHDTVIHQVDKWYPSSKTCSCCGFVNKELKLSEREWFCSSCGVLHDRDQNASKNILRQGIVEYSSKCKTVIKPASYVDGK
jgi:putative transposase